MITKNIFFDFDGVILDSMPVRAYGFRTIFKDFDTTLVDKLIKFHELNGGLSRFVKIRFFFEELLQKPIKDETVITYADNFSLIMKEELSNHKYLIEETVDYIHNNFKDYNLHIVSGSEENELRYLCEKLNIDTYFKSIHGSPTHKNKLVENLFLEYDYNKDETILIGDSINDYEAAYINGINFYGYNNDELKEKSYTYIDSFKNFK